MHMVKKISVLALLGTAMTSTSKVIMLNQDNYKKIVESSTKPVILDFYADWCQPCKLMKPVFEQLAEQYSHDYLFAQINADTSRELALMHKISVLPTFVVIKDNKRIGTIVGMVSKEQFITKLDGIFNPKPFAALTAEQKAEKLREAIMLGDLDQLKYLVAQGADVNTVFSDGHTPLLLTISAHASKPQGYDMVQTLLNAGAATQVTLGGQKVEIGDYLKQMIMLYSSMIEGYTKMLPLFERAVKSDEEHCVDGVCKIE